MAWVSTNEVPRQKRRASLTDEYQREYTRAFEVRFSSLLDDSYAALTAPNLPSVSDNYATDTNSDPDALCKRLTATEQAPWQVSRGVVGSCWMVEAFYTTASVDPSLQNDNPTDQPAEISYTSERVEFALQSDLDDEVICNSAGDPFDPPYMVDDCTQVITITENLTSFTQADQATYLNKVNANEIWGYAPGMVLCTQYDGRRAWRNHQEYWPRTTQFKIMGPLLTAITGGDWSVVALVDQGLRQLKPGSIASTNSPPSLMTAEGFDGCLPAVQYQPGPAAGWTQTVSFGFGGATGEFTLTFNGQTTAELTFVGARGPSPENVAAALNALTTIGSVGGAVSVVQLNPATPVYNITFGGALGFNLIPIMDTSTGAIVTKPVLLNGQGMAQTGPPQLNFKLFRVREKVDFSGMLLPLDV